MRSLEEIKQENGVPLTMASIRLENGAAMNITLHDGECFEVKAVDDEEGFRLKITRVKSHDPIEVINLSGGVVEIY